MTNYSYYLIEGPIANSLLLSIGPQFAPALAASLAWETNALSYHMLSTELAVSSYAIHALWQGSAHDRWENALSWYRRWVDTTAQNCTDMSIVTNELAQAYLRHCLDMPFILLQAVANRIRYYFLITLNALTLGLLAIILVPMIIQAEAEYEQLRIYTATVRAFYDYEVYAALDKLPTFTPAPQTTSNSTDSIRDIIITMLSIYADTGGVIGAILASLSSVVPLLVITPPMVASSKEFIKTPAIVQKSIAEQPSFLMQKNIPIAQTTPPNSSGAQSTPNSSSPAPQATLTIPIVSVTVNPLSRTVTNNIIPPPSASPKIPSNYTATANTRDPIGAPLSHAAKNTNTSQTPSAAQMILEEELLEEEPAGFFHRPIFHQKQTISLHKKGYS